MNVLDAAILLAAATAAFGGWRLGLLTRTLSWIGLGVGLALAVQLLPAIVRKVEGPDPAGRLLIAAVVLVIGSFAGQALGLLLGSRVHRSLPAGPLRHADKGAGAALGVFGILVSLWLILPSIARVPGAPARLAATSRVAQAIHSVAPDAPDALQRLGKVLGDSRFPQVFADLRPAPDTGPPPAELGMTPEVVARVTASTVKVEGEACRRLQEGSGFTAAPDLVVTNAHVVAGQRSTRVIRPDGRRFSATVVAFDPDRDLAVLRVPGLGQQPLAIGTGEVGVQGAVFGHPGGQESVRAAPAAIRERVEAVGRDLYDEADTRRDVWILAANLRPGDSGGALVDRGGVVIGVAFAIAPDRPGTSYALTPKELGPVLAAARQARGGTDTGPCLAA